MVTISIDEIHRDPSHYLRRVEAGETFLIMKEDRPVAEIKLASREIPSNSLRPSGLAAGEFTVPDDFDKPLPEEELRGFEGR
jgi:antitoxin (DNA-binding transcriptional repressor) of toxin-antitoxin stability system